MSENKEKPILEYDCNVPVPKTTNKKLLIIFFANVLIAGVSLVLAVLILTYLDHIWGPQSMTIPINLIMWGWLLLMFSICLYSLFDDRPWSERLILISGILVGGLLVLSLLIPSGGG